MMKFLELFVDALLVWISAYLIGKKLFEPKNTNIKILLTVILFFSSIVTIMGIINFEMFYGIVKIMFTYFLQCTFYRIIFKQSFSKCIIAALIYYVFIFFSEVITVLIASYILSFLGNSITFMKNNLVLNIIITFMSYALVILLNNKIKFIVKNSNFKIKSNIVIAIIILITIALLLYKIPLSKWNLNIEFFATMIILLSFITITIYLIKQRSDIEKTSSMYQQEAKYAKATSKVLEDYRMVNHEHKNQLSIIRGMTDKDNKKLLDYIDSLIDKKNDIKYKWVAELSYLPLDGLKSLINYKLIQMDEAKINLNIIISKELNKMRLGKLNARQEDNLYSIVGVYLDNAIQAASESKKKEVSLEIYKEHKDLVLIIGNTYKDKIDINRIDEYGYSTKGKNHGVGLHIVRKILDEDSLFSQSRKLLDDYYIQELRIHLNEIKKNKSKK